MIVTENYPSKSYKHIDQRIEYDKVRDYVLNPDSIKQHGFLPFIKFEKISEKMISKPNPEISNRPIKRKIRPLMYAGHLDGYIYKYYSDQLNVMYNKYAIYNDISDCAVAYRTFDSKKDKKSNINFAAEVINFISESNNSIVIVGDFTDYFGSINHEILKENLCEIMQVDRLPNDWFNIYNSLTRYGYYMQETLDNPLEETKGLFAYKGNKYFKSVKKFRKYQRIVKCEKNEKTHGIPQGSAISAAFSNVYAISFDRSLKRIANQFDGLYRRYSDDFILIFPNVGTDFEIENILREIEDHSADLKILINEDKKELLFYDGSLISDYRSHKKENLDYLGFIFDGVDVKMRQKSVYKFYRKAKRLTNKAKFTKRQKGLSHLPYRKQIYSLYTDMGIKSGDYGNFLSYARRSQDIFDLASPHTNNLMMKQMSKRKKKIEKLLGYRIHV